MMVMSATGSNPPLPNSGQTPKAIGLSAPKFEEPAITRQRLNFQRALQEYLAELDRNRGLEAPEHKRRMLKAYAELRYRVYGGDHCAVCRTHVRHVMTVTSWREDGFVAEYRCLCTRCLEGEKASCGRVALSLGGCIYEVHDRKDAGRAAA